MKCGNSNDLVHKDVVIIGNGPSGIALSYMLSGNVPYVTSTTHPDELLSIRLQSVLHQSLVDVNLAFLSSGLEGRTTNPVSLLLDSLVHPCADIGLEMDALVEWRRDGQKFRKFGHECEIQTADRELTEFAHANPLRRWFNRLRMINETNQRSYSFLRSQKKIINEHKKLLEHPYIIHPFSTFRHYLSRTFILDLFSSIPFDVIINAYEDERQPKSMQDWCFIGHYLGLIKLLRYYSFVVYTARMFDATMTEVYYVTHRIAIAFLTFMLYLHVITCLCIGWSHKQTKFSYRIASSPAIVKSYGNDITNQAHMYTRFLYSACLMVYNSGYGIAIYDHSAVLFTTNVWLCSRLLYILTIAYLIQLQTAIYSSSQKYVDMLCEVKDYMRHRQIPNFLQNRILAYYDIKFQDYFFQESEILNTVSSQLRQEIIMNTCRKLVEDVSFFKNLPLPLLVRIVSSLSYDIYLTNDVIAKVGTIGECMYFICNGTVAIYTSNGKEINHVVLGKGPPGGSWHSMDPDILTLSLGSWMSLPGLKYESCNGPEKRASAKSVAEYYVRYVRTMGLTPNFRDRVLVTKVEPYCMDEGECKGKWVEKVNNDICQKVRRCSRPERKDLARSKSYSLTNAFSYILNRGQDRCAKRSWEQNDGGRDGEVGDDQRLPDVPYAVRKKREKDRAFSPASTCELFCDKCNRNNGHMPSVPAHRLRYNGCDASARTPRWLVEAVDLETKACVRYTCNNLVLANGSSDLPNKLNISKYKTDPYWLLHDLRSLEIELDLHLQSNPDADPVLVVGAGLSAADAIIATKMRNVPVVHLFRHKTDLTKQLPENMYPEYHKVHQMMKNGANYPLYTPLAEYTLTNLDEFARKATITSKDGKSLEVAVSYVVVLIGSRPDLGFLPGSFNLGVRKQLPIDGKKNTVNIDKYTHQVIGHDGLYAIGPLAGDNFVRFLPGGALAVLSDIVRKMDAQ